MTKFFCGHSPDKQLSLDTVDHEKLLVPICNKCYNNHEKDIQKHKLEVIPI